MWTTLALLTALGVAPAQSSLSLTNVRSTHGLLGPQRQSEEVAPGDIYFVCFDIDGVSVGEDGKVRYGLGTTVSDSTGKIHFHKKPTETTAMISLGGNTVPAFAQLDVGLDTAPGDYRMKVTVTDPASNREAIVTRTVKVLPRDFALVRATVSLDVNAQYAAETFTCGQGIWVQCSAVEFGRGGNKQPDLTYEMRILDEAGKATTAKPKVHTVNKGIPGNQPNVPLAFPLSLNRPGKFTIEVLAHDRVKNKKAKKLLPIIVLSPKKG